MFDNGMPPQEGPPPLTGVWRRIYGLDPQEEQEKPKVELSPIWRKIYGIPDPVPPEAQSLPPMAPDSPFNIGVAPTPGVAPAQQQDPFAQQRNPTDFMPQPVFGDIPFTPGEDPSLVPGVQNAQIGPMQQAPTAPIGNQGVGPFGMPQDSEQLLGQLPRQDPGMMQPDPNYQPQPMVSDRPQVLPEAQLPTPTPINAPAPEAPPPLEGGEGFMGRDLTPIKKDTPEQEAARQQNLQDTLFMEPPPLTEVQTQQLDEIRTNVRKQYAARNAENLSMGGRVYVEALDALVKNPTFGAALLDKMVPEEQQTFISDLAEASTGNINKVTAILGYAVPTIAEVFGGAAAFGLLARAAAAGGAVKTAAALKYLSLNPTAMGEAGRAQIIANAAREEGSFLAANLVRGEKSALETGIEAVAGFGLGVGVEMGSMAFKSIKGARAAQREGRVGMLTAGIEKADGTVVRARTGDQSHLMLSDIAEEPGAKRVFFRDDGKKLTEAEGNVTRGMGGMNDIVDEPVAIVQDTRQVEPAAPEQVNRAPERRVSDVPVETERRVGDRRGFMDRARDFIASKVETEARKADPLTGLRGKRAWNAAVDAAEQDPNIAVGTVDIRNLTGMNELTSHTEADVYLKKVAAQMQEEFGQEFSFRLGDKADEFAVIGPEIGRAHV